MTKTEVGLRVRRRLRVGTFANRRARSNCFVFRVRVRVGALVYAGSD